MFRGRVREREFFFSLFSLPETAKLDFYSHKLKHSLYAVNTSKCPHEDKSALLIKEVEVNTTMWMDK